MKTVHKLLLAFICIPFIFSCGDDEKYEVIPQGPKTDVHNYTVPLEGNVRYDEVFLSLDTLRLVDMIGFDPAQNLTSAELQYDNTYMEIKGLKALNPSPELQNIRLEVNGKIFNLGTASAGPSDLQSDVKQSSKNIRYVLEYIFDQVKKGNKEVRLRIGFKTTENFVPQDNVTLNLVFNIKYSWNSYSKK